MSKLIEKLIDNSSSMILVVKLLIFVFGIILIILGATKGYKSENFDLSVEQSYMKITLIIIGSVLIVYTLYLLYKDTTNNTFAISKFHKEYGLINIFQKAMMHLQKFRIC